MTESQKNISEEKSSEVGSVEIEYFTDPLCCWSWAFEPQWRKLRSELRGKIKWRYIMGGLIPNWDNFNDPMNTVNRPQQMGPVWMEAKHISGQPIFDRVWFENPIASSFPACIAVKAAQLQSPMAAEVYLRATREAVMIHGKDIAKRNVLFSISKEVEEDSPEIFSAERFEADFRGEEARSAFEEDLKMVRLHGIGRFPTLTICKEGESEGVMIVGYRPYAELLKAVQQVVPELIPDEIDIDENALKGQWTGLTDREIKEFETGTSNS